MKKYIAHLILAAAACLCVSCTDWLDVMQDDSIPEEDLFSNYSGFRTALNGIYQSMAAEELFGKELSYGFVSALSQYLNNYSASDGLVYSSTEKYDYETNEVRAFAKAIWEKGYKVIADCNNLIQHAETADPEMFPFELEQGIILGEARAVRALMHFELVRLFGPVPAAGLNQTAIPYVDTYPSTFNDRKSMQEVFTLIMEDLEYAFDAVGLWDKPYRLTEEDILGPAYDGMTGTAASSSSPDINRFKIMRLGNNDPGEFFWARGYRMNSVAIKSLMARVCAYMGDMETAYEHASLLYTTKRSPTSTALLMGTTAATTSYYPYTAWTASHTIGVWSHKLMPELILGLYRINLPTTYETRAMSSTDNSYQLKNIEYMYNTFRNDPTDVRLTKLIAAATPTASNRRHYSVRYTWMDNTAANENFTIPLIRMAELRYIMAEYQAKSGDIPGAVAILNEHRTRRSCTRSLAPSMSLDEFMEELFYDMWKEFTAEGQLFFQYKRLNAPTIPTGQTYIEMTPEKYRIPIPDSETIF